jgi:hypothetical protein
MTTSVEWPSHRTAPVAGGVFVRPLDVLAGACHHGFSRSVVCAVCSEQFMQRLIPSYPPNPMQHVRVLVGDRVSPAEGGVPS